jgi:hypothetical protein
MGGCQAGDLAVLDLDRHIDFARLGQLVLAVLFDLIAEQSAPVLMLLLFLCQSYSGDSDCAG